MISALHAIVVVGIPAAIVLGGRWLALEAERAAWRWHLRRAQRRAERDGRS